MPRLDNWALALWMAVIAAQPLLAAWMVWVGTWRRWPSLFTFLSVHSAVSFALVILHAWPSQTDTVAAAYFYTYWASAAISCVLHLWMMVELGCAACAGPRTCAFIRRVIPAAAFLFFVAAIALNAGSQIPYPLAAMRNMVIFSRIVSLGWAITFAVIVYSCDFFGLRWSRADRRLALGLAFQVCGESVVSWFLDRRMAVARTSALQEFLYLASLFVWGCALRSEDDSGFFPSQEYLKALAEPCLEIGQILRGR